MPYDTAKHKNLLDWGDLGSICPKIIKSICCVRIGKKMLSVSIKSVPLARVSDFPPAQTWSPNDLSQVSSLGIQ